jgi:hypothetical protein
MTIPEFKPIAWTNKQGDYFEAVRKDTVFGSHTRPLYTSDQLAEAADLIEHQAAQIEQMRQQLADSQKQVVMLREVVNRNIECIHFEDTGPEAELCVVFSREALAATADLDGLILCHAEPAAIVYRDYGGNGAILQTELADDEPLYRARGDSK